MIARFYEFRSQIIQPVIFEGPPIGKLDFYPKSGKIIVCSVPRSTINTFFTKNRRQTTKLQRKNMSLPLGIFSDRPLRMRIDRRSHQICQWEYIWSYFHIAEFIGTGGGDIQSPGHQTFVLSDIFH